MVENGKNLLVDQEDLTGLISTIVTIVILTLLY